MHINQFLNSIPDDLCRGFSAAISAALLAPKNDTYNKKLYRVGAAVTSKNGKYIFQQEHNKYKTHPRFKDFKSQTLHAERMVLLNRLHIINSLLFVVRLKRDNTLACACPCYDCSVYIRQSGIKKTYYSMDGIHANYRTIKEFGLNPSG